MEKPTHACSACGQQKEESDYSKTQKLRLKKGNRAKCKRCVADDDIKRRYPSLKNGMADKQKMVERCGNKCEICDKALDGGGPQTFIDHNHKTNAVRGLLCSNCNFGFGHFGDKPVLLAKAIAYALDKDGLEDDETSEELVAHMEKLALVTAKKRAAKK